MGGSDVSAFRCPACGSDRPDVCGLFGHAQPVAEYRATGMQLHVDPEATGVSWERWIATTRIPRETPRESAESKAAPDADLVTRGLIKATDKARSGRDSQPGIDMDRLF